MAGGRPWNPHTEYTVEGRSMLGRPEASTKREKIFTISSALAETAEVTARAAALRAYHMGATIVAPYWFLLWNERRGRRGELVMPHHNGDGEYRHLVGGGGGK